MIEESNHSWNVTPKEAIEIQKRLRDQVRIESFEAVHGPIDGIRYIAAADVSMNLYSNTVYAGFVILSWPDLRLVDHEVVKATTKFPYVPGLLSFREIPALMEAWQRLLNKQKRNVAAGRPVHKPELIIVDGMGIAHPRRIGIASHLGVMLDIPTIGSAKSLLTGVHAEPGNEASDFAYLYEKNSMNKANDEKEVIGAVMRTKRNVKPIYVSPGHRINLTESMRIISACIRRHRLPDPIRAAHDMVNAYRKGEMGEGKLAM